MSWKNLKKISLKSLLFISLAGLISCGNIFEKNQRLMGDFKLQNGNLIELYYIGYGATTPNVIWINEKKEAGGDTIINKIDGFDYKYIISFNQLNDSLLKIVFTDTAYFKGRQTERVVNLNQRIKVPPALKIK